jgi:hypothetical protein
LFSCFFYYMERCKYFHLLYFVFKTKIIHCMYEMIVVNKYNIPGRSLRAFTAIWCRICLINKAIYKKLIFPIIKNNLEYIKRLAHWNVISVWLWMTRLNLSWNCFFLDIKMFYKSVEQTNTKVTTWWKITAMFFLSSWKKHFNNLYKWDNDMKVCFRFVHINENMN